MIVSNDGHFGAVTARLLEHPFDKLHKYIWIHFKSGVKGLVAVLGLWSLVVDRLGKLPPFLLRMKRKESHAKGL